MIEAAHWFDLFVGATLFLVLFCACLVILEK